MNLLSDKVAIVTGASSGIRRATASLFARQDTRVVPPSSRPQETPDTT